MLLQDPFIIIIIHGYTHWHLILKSVIFRVLESDSRVSQVLIFLKLTVVINPVTIWRSYQDPLKAIQVQLN